MEMSTVTVLPAELKAGSNQPATQCNPKHDGEYEAVSFVTPTRLSKQSAKGNEEEPLIDNTAALTLHSKRTDRIQKKQQKKMKRTTVTSDTKSFLELPPELLLEVLYHLRPSEITRLLYLSRSSRIFVLDNEPMIAQEIVRRRYSTLGRSFPLPTPFGEVDETAQSALLSFAWQSRLQIHKKPYQHVQQIDPQKICTCMTCVLAWNNLCMVLDLAHFQHHLDDRQPIPMVSRGTYPQWNQMLIQRHARHVEEAMKSPLCYARILEVHLDTTFATLTRQVRVGKKTVPPRRLFRLSQEDVKSESDHFLERSGPPSYEFPYHRDIYYSIEAYVPNRKWSAEEQRWQYYSPGKAHENDLAWVVARFRPETPILPKQVDLDNLRDGFEQQLTFRRGQPGLQRQ